MKKLALLLLVLLVPGFVTGCKNTPESSERTVSLSAKAPSDEHEENSGEETAEPEFLPIALPTEGIHPFGESVEQSGVTFTVKKAQRITDLSKLQAPFEKSRIEFYEWAEMTYSVIEVSLTVHSAEERTVNMMLLNLAFIKDHVAVEGVASQELHAMTPQPKKGQNHVGKEYDFEAGETVDFVLEYAYIETNKDVPDYEPRPYQELCLRVDIPFSDDATVGNHSVYMELFPEKAE